MAVLLHAPSGPKGAATLALRAARSLHNYPLEVNVMNGRLHIAGAAVLMLGCAHSNTAGEPELRTATSINGPATSQATSQAVLDKELVSDFRERVDDYMELQEKLQRQGTRQKQRDNVAENEVSQQALAMRIRFARHDARPGDIFTRPIAMALRRALNPELRGVAALTTRESIREDAPATFVLAVNADYPPGASRSNMPPNVLNILPPLPKGLEYRVVDSHLLLMDIEANIILDYILDVMCKTC